MNQHTQDKVNFYNGVYFNESIYLQNKANALNKQVFEGRADWTGAEVLAGLQAQNLSGFKHFSLFGAFEQNAAGTKGIDPSAFFNVNRYYTEKLALAQKNGQNATMDDLVSTFQKGGLDPISHYAQFGCTEYVTPLPTWLGATPYTEIYTIPPHNDLPVNSLLYGTFSDVNARFAKTKIITYTFMETDIQRQVVRDDLVVKNFAVLNENQRTAVFDAMKQISAVTGLEFKYSADQNNSDLYFHQGITPDALAWTTPEHSGKRAIVLSNQEGTYYQKALQDPRKGVDPEGFSTILHEMGHFMGLKHPNEAPNTLPPETEKVLYSTMSYTRPLGDKEAWYNLTNSSDHYGPYDLLALAYIYGRDGINGKEGLIYNGALTAESGTSGTEVAVAGTTAPEDMGIVG